MWVDPRFSLSVDEVDGQARLRFSALSGIEIAEAVPVLARLGMEELLDLARAPDMARKGLSDPGERLVWVNGWQSWSFAGELAAGERVRRSLLPSLNLYTDRPGPRERRPEFLSHFLACLRAGDGRLVMLSRGVPGREGAGGPPLSFRIRRRPTGLPADSRRGDLSIEALAGGAAFSAGEAVAEVRLFFRVGFFAARDGIRLAYRGWGRFDRLAFLGHGGSLVPGGWESWYSHYLAIDEGIVGRELEALGANDNIINAYYLRRGKPTVFQVDDGWERAIGDWEPDPARFPGGMKALAARVEAAGMVPGLWLAPLLVMGDSTLFRERTDLVLKDAAGKPLRAGWNPGWGGDFHVLDLSQPEAAALLDELFEKVVEDWGYRYLKLDFLYAGLLPGAFARGGAAYDHYGRVMNRITSRARNRRGLPVAWLGCGAPLEPSFRGFPLMRIGADTKETWEFPLARLAGHQGRPAARVNLAHTIGRSLLDGALFVNDPDVAFLREEGMGYGEREKELILLVDSLLASQLMVSDDPSRFGPEAEFTARATGLLDSLAGREYGAERIGPALFRLASRDGRVEGAVNLGSRPARLPAARAGATGRPLLFHGSLRDGDFILEPRSISLFEK